MRTPTPARPGHERLALVPPPPASLLRDVLGARLRLARAAQGRSLRDVAAIAGVSIGHLSQVERGLAEASSEVLAAICRALEVPLHVLLRAAALDLTTTAPADERAVLAQTRLADVATMRALTRPRAGDVRAAA